MFTTLPDSSSESSEEAESLTERWLTSDNPETLAMAYRRLSGELRDRALVRLQSIDGDHDLGDGVELHIREGGVANGGNETWYLNDRLHRVDGPARQWEGGVANGGGEEWCLNDKPHRVDGPAWQWNGGVANGGGESWRLNGEQHRVDGPSEQWDGGVANGGGEAWWVDGEKVVKEDVMG